MKKNLLITGATGMLGATLVKYFEKDYYVYATSTKNSNFYIGENFKEFDLASLDYSKLLEWSKPNFIIHCAAITNGNYCEQHPEEAILINGIALQKMAKVSSNKPHIIYISTDAVFSNETSYVSENHYTNPDSMYGKSKEIGEFFLTHSHANHTIVRTTIVGTNLNKSRQGFVEWMINSSKQGKEIILFDDVKFTPISIWNLANQLKYIIENASRFSRKTLHIAGSEVCTKYEFGIALLKSLNLPTEFVKRGSIMDYEDRAKRSTDQTLNCNLYIKENNIQLPTLVETIQEIKDNYNETN